MSKFATQPYGTAAWEDQQERMAEARDGMIDTYAEQLYSDYIHDKEIIYEVLTADSNVLADLAEAASRTDQVMFDVIRKYVRAKAMEDAEEQLGDR